MRSVAAARTFLHETLQQDGTQTQRPADAVSNAVLMLSELLTNAIRHTHQLLLLEITVRDNTLYVAVIDDAPGLPTLREPDHHATSGRGLRIVDALADRWGYTPGTGRKTVWFEIALP